MSTLTIEQIVTTPTTHKAAVQIHAAHDKVTEWEGKTDSRYSAYVDSIGTEFGEVVHAENLSAHVNSIMAASKEFGGVKASSRADKGTAEYKAHVRKCAVHNGLKRAAGIEGKKKVSDGHLLTSDGVSTLAGLTDDEIVAAIRAELDKRGGTDGE